MTRLTAGGPRSRPARHDAGRAAQRAREVAAQRALNGVCPYYTMFPLDFPLAQLRDATPGDLVIDPFCGRGSTSYAARLRGLASLGVDSSPVAAAIAQAKVVVTTPADVVAACREILATAPTPVEVPQEAFWAWCYHPWTLEQLAALREALRDDCETPARQALLALLLGRLHGPRNVRAPYSYCSNQMPRTYASKPAYAVRFFEARGLEPPLVDVLDLVERMADHYFAAAAYRAAAGSVAVHADSRTVDLTRHLPDGQLAGWVVTSPPYYGMRTYVPDQWLRNWFVGGPADVPYTFQGQLDHGSPKVFAASLGEVWRNVARACRPGARLIVRFGAIQDREHDARDILAESLRAAGCGWRTMTVRNAGSAAAGRRQADQFLAERSTPIDEFDLYARLKT